MYILTELEPSDEVTGGLWYMNNEFDKELLDALCNRTLEYIA